MDDDELDPNEVVMALMQVNAMLEPIIEFAEGMRAQLIQKGWSAEVADNVSGDVLKRLITMGMGGPK
jgi:hypothetical protein